MKAGVRKTIEGLKSYMEKHGYTGLSTFDVTGEEGCGCEIDDLAPCGCDHSECILGWRIECTEEEAKKGYCFMVTNKKPAPDQGTKTR